MHEIQASKFRDPQPQAALGGQVGLTSWEIAESIGASHDNVTRAIRAYIALDSSFPHSEGLLPARGGHGGNPSRVFTLPVVEARIVVAQYKSKIGYEYTRYLVEFEKNAREGEERLRAVMTQLQEEVAELRARLEATTKLRALPSAKTALVTELLTRHDSLMGDGEVIERHLTRVETSGLTKLEIKKAKRVMLILQQEGLARAIRKASDEIDFLEQPAALRLRAVKPS